MNAIDEDVVHGKDGNHQPWCHTCGIFSRFPDDEPKQIDQTNQRWSSPTHPEGHGLATAEKILDLAHKHICPDF
ncbi:hypothetical protein [Streptomyces sp. M3]|uniref:hypothetical protein n=1 Tax=Streptomyces sp. M3 TaxID=295102 RepID=UPI00100E69DB|nr:hypothetical protein [Streptomyces sp. M3]